MKYFDVTRLLSGALEANGQRGTATAFVILLLSSGLPASAQSFFASNVTDPAAGVDRGSTSGIRKLDAPTAFLTFDTYGSEDIGPNILGLGYVQPDMAFSGDQLDVVGVIAGPSAEDSLELRAGGIGYRFPALGTRTEGIAYLSYANIALGTEANLAFDVSGTLSIGAVGIRHTAERENDAKLTSTAEVIARRATGTAFGTQVIDEDLRLLRVSTLYQQGLPNLFQRRFAAAVTVGLDALGASETSNGQASLRAQHPSIYAHPSARKPLFPCPKCGSPTLASSDNGARTASRSRNAAAMAQTPMPEALIRLMSLATNASAHGSRWPITCKPRNALIPAFCSHRPILASTSGGFGTMQTMWCRRAPTNGQAGPWACEPSKAILSARPS